MKTLSVSTESRRLGIVIPAFNEEESIGLIVDRCLIAANVLGSVRVIVCDNGSQDSTAIIARNAGAEIVHVDRKGYGAACQGGISYLANWPDILIFVDADGSSQPEEIPALIEPVIRGVADLVIGRRPWSAPMTPPQRWGTWLAVKLVNSFWRSDFTDMGPFRCIDRESLNRLGMRDQTWGWTIEMQILAQMKGLRVQEVPVSWDERMAGTSKISGTFCGVIKAGSRILWTVARYAFTGSRA